MPPVKSTFLDKVLGQIGRLDAQGLQAVVHRLARERTFLETLFNTIEDGVLVVDEQGRILYFNEASTRLLGFPLGSEGEPVQKHFPELDWESLSRLDADGGTRVIRQEFEVHYPQLRFIHLYAAPLDGERSGSAGVALILRDATEARQKNFEAIESERVQALTLLAASVAHEIGNPLHALHIHLQLMEREVRKLRIKPVAPAKPGRFRRVALGVRAEPEPDRSAESLDKVDEYLRVAKGEITRLDYIITQFLEALRPRPIQTVMISLNEIMRETAELLRPEIENRGQQLIEKPSPSLPLAPLDPGQIKQVLVNLMKNAMQAMTQGGRLTLQTGTSTGGVWVAISDTGPGIPQEMLNRIFEPFYTTKAKGSGLGLMIVQRIVREHNGRIDLESRANEGTTFRLWFPTGEKRTPLLPPKSGMGA